jgi:hypothetical protein
LKIISALRGSGNMPPPSEASRKFWWAMKGNPSEAKRKGISEKVVKEFTDSDPGGKLPARVKDGKPVGRRFGSLG